MATDKRSTQISLPLEFHDKDYRGLVKQNWQITFARQSNVGVYGKRIMGLVLSEIRANDYQGKEYYQFRVADVMKASELTDKKRAYLECKNALRELMKTTWEFEDPDQKIWKGKQLINTNTSLETHGYEYGYKNGLITVVFNDTMHKMLVDIAHYSSFELEPYMRFKSWYSTRFWEILSAYQDTGKWTPSLEDYRKFMDCEKKYKDVNWMIEKTTAEPLEELKGTDLEFTFEKVFDKLGGRGRPGVVGLDFKLVRSLLNDDEILAKWAKHSDGHAQMINKLHHEWKITQVCLRKYLPIIKMEGARELLLQFEKMESIGTKRKIDSREKYCNAAIKRMADKITMGD